MSGHTWKNVDSAVAERIRAHLLEKGGEEREVKAVTEKWRIRLSDATFTYYARSTLYSTPSPFNDPAVLEAWNYIESLVDSYKPPTKDFLIGLDETGKGEVIGHLILSGVIFPRDIYGKVNSIGKISLRLHAVVLTTMHRAIFFLKQVIELTGGLPT